jgi:DNA polymerase elongation subunit (family B)
MKGEFFNCPLVMINNVPHIRFLGRFEDKSKLDLLVKGHNCFFYILTSELNKVDFLCEKQSGFKSIYGDDLTKLSFSNPWDIKDFRLKFTKTFAADIPYPTQFLIEKNIKTGIEVDSGKLKHSNSEVLPRIMMLDIENIYSGGSNDDRSCPTMAISFHDNYTDKFYSIAFNKERTESKRTFIYYSEVMKREYECDEFIVKNETELLEKFKSYVLEMDPDIFSGWNVCFDLVYIYTRLEFLGLNPNSLSPIGKCYTKGNWPDKTKKIKSVTIVGRNYIDLLPAYKKIKWKSIDSFKLDEVGKSEFGIGKIEYKGWMKDFWETDFNRFLEYNRKDIEICLAVDKKYSAIDIQLGFRRITGCRIDDVDFNSRMLDIYILRECKDKLVLPTKVYREMSEKEDVEGGFVAEPAIGLFKNVACLDMSSFYPNIMLAYNMSPETIDMEKGEMSVGNGVRFTNKKIGISVEILKTLLKKREEVRKMLKDPEINKDPVKYLNLYKKQYSFKTFQNSYYGVTLFPSFRLFDPRIGSSITYTGRTLTHKIIEHSESKGYKVIRGDSDSVFVSFGDVTTEKAIELGKELEKEINSKYPEWFKENKCDTSFFSIKFEKLAGIMFSGKEKKLYGLKNIWDWEKGLLKKPEIEIKGFAVKRGDRSHFSRNMQKHVFEMIFEEKSKDEILEYVYEEIRNFKNKKYDWETIGIPKAITQDIEDYKTDNPYIRGTKWSQKNIIGFTSSPKPYLLYLNKTSKYDTDVICFENNSQVPDDIEINWKRMAECDILNILKNVCSMVGIKEEDIEFYIDNVIHGQKTLF